MESVIFLPGQPLPLVIVSPAIPNRHTGLLLNTTNSQFPCDCFAVVEEKRALAIITDGSRVVDYESKNGSVARAT